MLLDLAHRENAKVERRAAAALWVCVAHSFNTNALAETRYLFEQVISTLPNRSFCSFGRSTWKRNGGLYIVQVVYRCFLVSTKWLHLEPRLQYFLSELDDPGVRFGAAQYCACSFHLVLSIPPCRTVIAENPSAVISQLRNLVLWDHNFSAEKFRGFYNLNFFAHGLISLYISCWELLWQAKFVLGKNIMENLSVSVDIRILKALKFSGEK